MPPQLVQTLSLTNKLTPEDREAIVRFIQGERGMRLSLATRVLVMSEQERDEHQRALLFRVYTEVGVVWKVGVVRTFAMGFVKARDACVCVQSLLFNTGVGVH